MSIRLVHTALSLLALAILFVPLERVFPARSNQPFFRRAWSTDLCFFLGQYLFFNQLALVALQHGAKHLPRFAPIAAWAHAVPWFSIPCAVLAGDLGVYFFHRACHRYAWLWRFHKVHHTSEDLDWLAAHREHPVDGLLTQLFLNLPAMLLGIPVSWLMGLAVFRGLWAVLVHSNVSLPLGPLGFFLGSPELHRLHHAAHGATYNYANLAPYLDWLFGTHRAPKSIDFPLGVANERPPGYARALVEPLLPTRAFSETSRRRSARSEARSDRPVSSGR